MTPAQIANDLRAHANLFGRRGCDERSALADKLAVAEARIADLDGDRDD